MGTGTATAMTTILTNVGSIVTASISWIGSYVSTITASGNEILFLFVALPIVGLAIGLLKRLISL